MRRSVIFAGSLLLLPVILFAQGRGAAPAMSMAAHPMIAVPHAVAHVSGGPRIISRGTSPRGRVGSGAVRVTGRPHSVSPGTTTHRQFDQFAEDNSSAPGLGFDEVHFAATHPRDRDRRRRNDFAAFFPFFDGGFFLPSAPVVVDESAGEAQPGEVAGNDAPAPEPPQHARTHTREQAEAPVISRDTAPEPPVKTDEYVFVRRDGTVFFAIAYAWDSNGTLRYITTEGFRRSVTRESLDLDATQQFNEQRGLTFRVPA